MPRGPGHPPPTEEFGHRVRTLREGLGVSQERFGDMVGLHRTYIGSVERGERNVSLVNIVRLAATLRVDPAELVRGLRP